MNEFTEYPSNIAYEDIFINRPGEPVHLMRCDAIHGHSKLEDKAGNQLQFYSMQKELWSIQFINGVFLLGVGNPFFNRDYRSELYDAAELNKGTYEWLRNCFNEHGINTVEQCVMVSIKGTTRLLVDKSGLWRLILPDGKVQIGMGDCSPDSPQMKAVSKRMKNFFGIRYINYITGLFDLLRPVEFESFQ